MKNTSGIRQVRAVTQAVGRRTALRYLAIGVGASLLAACRTDHDNSKDADRTSGAGTGPVGQAFSAFVLGKWRVEVIPAGNGSAGTVLAEITASSWTIGKDGQDSSWGGQWALLGSKLAIQGPESPNDLDELVEVAALHVPGKVGRTESLLLPWQPPGGSSADTGQELKVTYAKGTLKIVHIDGASRTEFTCTRM